MAPNSALNPNRATGNCLKTKAKENATFLDASCGFRAGGLMIFQEREDFAQEVQI